MAAEPILLGSDNAAEVDVRCDADLNAGRRENGLEIPPTVRKRSRDGSSKYVFVLRNELQYEASAFRILGRERPNIACVSTQLGCAVGCRFCAAGNGTFYRNLTKDEILHQIQTILRDMDFDSVMEEGLEVSFMGMGEPLANLPNLLEAIHEIGNRYARVSRVSVSTAGPAQRISSLIRAMPTKPPVHLQVSLHATGDRLRRSLIPYAPDSIENLIAAAQTYHDITGDVVFLNYVLLRGLNDSAADAKWLAGLNKEAFLVKVSALNATDGLPKEFCAANLAEILAFCQRLKKLGVPHKIFVGDGLDVEASCGQLAAVPREVKVNGI
jgi:23S rRNA (adenine2503-C2)-methyltransferase